MAAGDVEPEVEIVSAELGRELAEAWEREPRELTIPDTLLSSDDITKVVEATGLVSPYYTGGGRYSRLKKAAYEGRIGTRAYRFQQENGPKRCFDRDHDAYLEVPKNSIVFVECDLDFRLPDFVALRFNLQIQHVHRGLLLGTGPLIDPGYWGKLCIPLHNLTDEDYRIPKDVGLIWIEFTKTTLPAGRRDPARSPLEGARSTARGRWNIEDFLNKAASQYYGHKVPIRSSLPTMFDEANRKAEKSATAAVDAAKSAEGLHSLNTFAMMAAGIALASLIVSGLSFVSNLSSRNEEIAVRLRTQTDEAQHALKEHITDIDRYVAQPLETRAALPGLRRTVESQQREIVDLKRQIQQLRSNFAVVEQATAILATQQASADIGAKK
jgi:deoxycytidine triphosphate deaminase